MEPRDATVSQPHRCYHNNEKKKKKRKKYHYQSTSTAITTAIVVIVDQAWHGMDMAWGDARMRSDQWGKHAYSILTSWLGQYTK